MDFDLYEEPIETPYMPLPGVLSTGAGLSSPPSSASSASPAPSENTIHDFDCMCPECLPTDIIPVSDSGSQGCHCVDCQPDRWRDDVKIGKTYKAIKFILDSV